MAPGAPSDSRGPTIVAVVSVFTALCVVTTALRVGVRWRNRALGWDDYLIIVNAAVLIAHWVITILEVQGGFGKHVEFVSRKDAAKGLQYSLIAQTFLYVTLTLPKFSICIFILRIKDYGWPKYLLWAMASGLVATNLLCFVVLLAQCQPVSAYWNKSYGTDACWSPEIYEDVIWVSVGYSIFSDIACTLLPVIILWNIQMKRRLKFAVSGLMSLGLVATIAAIVRGYYSAKNNGTKDPTYDLAIITIWAIIEMTFSMLGANFALSRYVYLFLKEHRRGPSFTFTTSQQRRYVPSSNTSWKATSWSTRGFAEIGENGDEERASNKRESAVDIRTDVYVGRTRNTPVESDEILEFETFVEANRVD